MRLQLLTYTWAICVMIIPFAVQPCILNNYCWAMVFSLQKKKVCLLLSLWYMLPFFMWTQGLDGFMIAWHYDAKDEAGCKIVSFCKCVLARAQNKTPGGGEVLVIF